MFEEILSGCSATSSRRTAGLGTTGSAQEIQQWPREHCFKATEIEAIAASWAARRVTQGRAAAPRWPKENFRSDELFFEPRLQQALPHGRFFLFELGRNSNISIECRQRKIVKLPRTGIETIQTMCPSSDKNHVAEPGLQRDDEFRKRFESGISFAHGSDDSSAGDRILLQIRSACSLPRDGCWLTSSQT